MVVAEGELVEVGGQMLPRDSMISPIDRPLKLAPKTLKGVGVEDALDVFAFPVGNGPVRVAQGSNLPIAGEFVGGHGRTGLDVSLNQRPQGFALHVVNDLGANLAATLRHSKDCRFTGCAASAPSRMLPADVRFVGLNDSAQESAAGFHHESDLLRNPPSAFIGYSKLALKLLGRNPILRLTHEEDRMEPECQRRRALVEYRTGCRVDLMAAPRADVRSPCGDRVIAIFVMALRALDSVRVLVLEDCRQAGFVVGVVFAEVVDRVFHANSIAGKLSVAKG